VVHTLFLLHPKPLQTSCRKNDAERVIRKMVAAHLLQEVTTRQDNQYGSVVRGLPSLSRQKGDSCE
jgi:hypothetical protein